MKVHFWHYVLDEGGNPIANADIRFYLAGSAVEANIFITNDGLNTSTTSEASIQTDDDGFFEFWVGDEFETIGAYSNTQKFMLTWNKAGTASGEIDNITLFTNVTQVDETDNITSTKDIKDKMVSNYLAYQWTNHISEKATEGAHDLEAVDYTDTDTTYNKLVSNSLMNYIFSVLTSAGTISIAATGAVSNTFTVNAWSATATDPVLYYADIDHFLGRQFPLVQVRKANGEEVKPIEVVCLTTNTLRIWMRTNTTAYVTIVG